MFDMKSLFGKRQATQESQEPTKFTDIVGQERVKNDLRFIASAFVKNSVAPDHMIFTGPAGVGKTTMAKVMAGTMGVGFHEVLGTSLNNWQDCLDILVNVKANDIVFIDEIHTIKPKLQTALYPVLSSFEYDVVEGTGKDKKQSRLKMPKFTVVGATTHDGFLNDAFCRRFPTQIDLEPYSVAELVEIIKSHAARRLHVDDFPTTVAYKLAYLSRSNASAAVNLLLGVNTYVEAMTDGKPIGADFQPWILDDFLRNRELDPFVGLNRLTRQYLSILVTENRPIGLKSLASMLNREPENIEYRIEPFLVGNRIDVPDGKDGRLTGPFITTGIGRSATEMAEKYLKMCYILQRDEGWFKNEHFPEAVKNTSEYAYSKN